MAQSTFHFSVGMLTGMLVMSRAVVHAWRNKKPLARPLGIMLLVSSGLGIYAVTPSIARRLLNDPDVGQSAFWNLFLLYSMIGRIPLPTIVVGEFLIALLFTVQYALLLYGIWRSRQRSQS